MQDYGLGLGLQKELFMIGRKVGFLRELECERSNQFNLFPVSSLLEGYCPPEDSSWDGDLAVSFLIPITRGEIDICLAHKLLFWIILRYFYSLLGSICFIGNWNGPWLTGQANDDGGALFRLKDFWNDIVESRRCSFAWEVFIYNFRSLYNIRFSIFNLVQYLFRCSVVKNYTAFLGVLDFLKYMLFIQKYRSFAISINFSKPWLKMVSWVVLFF